MNRQVIIGNLGQDPELRYTASGIPVATLSVASNRDWTDAEGNAHRDVTWFRVIAWRKLGEVCNQYLSKGRQVYVEGRTQHRQYQDKEGNTQRISEVIAERVQFLGAATASKPEPAPGSEAQPQTEAPPPNIDDDDIPF